MVSFITHDVCTNSFYQAAFDCISHFFQFCAICSLIYLLFSTAFPLYNRLQFVIIWIIYFRLYSSNVVVFEYIYISVYNVGILILLLLLCLTIIMCLLCFIIRCLSFFLHSTKRSINSEGVERWLFVKLEPIHSWLEGPMMHPGLLEYSSTSFPERGS